MLHRYPQISGVFRECFMADVSDDRLTAEAQIARVMSLLAESPVFEVTAPKLLDLACSTSGAATAACLSFENASLAAVLDLAEDLVPSHAEVHAALSKEQGVWRKDLPAMLADYRAWLLLPLRTYGQLTGAMILLSKDQPAATANKDVLTGISDALALLFLIAIREERYSQTMRKHHEFLRFVTHDLRSPLTIISGFAGMMESQTAGALNEQQTRYVHKILSGVKELAFLVDNIQDAGRYDPDTGFYEMERNILDLGPLVKKVVETRLIPATKRDFQIEHSIDPDLPIINADATMLERAITNLVDNAIKYTHQDGRVLVRVQRDAASILISVQDNGVGVAPEHFEKLFQRNYRVQRQDKKVKGSGLGLFIVRSVARHHNGDAWVESVEGQGSTFHIRIPLSGANLPSPLHTTETS